MPDLPIVEQIAQHIVASLNNISVAGGFHNDVVVERFRRQGQRARDNLLVVMQGDEAAADDSPPQGRLEWVQPYAVICYVTEHESGDAIDQRINTIRADVQRALLIDPKRDGLAIDTLLRPSEIFPPEAGGGFSGVTVFIDVHYRVEFADPNTQG
jgi:hypothetical protein